MDKKALDEERKRLLAERRHELHLICPPGSPQARREKLKQALPVLEKAHENGWRWSDILDMAREMLGEPNLTLRALINLRYRYRLSLAEQKRR